MKIYLLSLLSLSILAPASSFALPVNNAESKQLIASGVKTYNYRRTYKSRRIAQSLNDKSRSYKEHIRKRVEESWGTYNIRNTTAKVRVHINANGSISSSKLVSFTGEKFQALKTIEAIKYATPFGKPPGSNNGINVNLDFRQNRVLIAGAKPTTAPKVKKRPHKVEVVRSRYSKKQSATFNTKQEARDLLEYLSN